MATIQVRLDDNIKNAADNLFTSLGLDTSTAVRMFIAAAINNRGIPFIVAHKTDPDTKIKEAIERRKSNIEFLTAEQSLANMRSAIEAGVASGGYVNYAG